MAAGALFAASYDDNPFQRKSRELSEMAEAAYSEGDYDMAAEYAREAEENARLSEAYIRKMIARSEAETEMGKARERVAWATEVKADENFPDEYSAAVDYVDRGSTSFDEEDYDSAKTYAQLALEALSAVEEVAAAEDAAPEEVAAVEEVAAAEEEAAAAEEAVAEEVAAAEEVAPPTFPARYRVESWITSRDCFWTIAANSAVYADPYLWPKLYEANKDRIPKPDNPDLIMPGTIIEIPSLWGERREGLYDPAADYGDIRDVQGRVPGALAR